jgi:hypothetical protein
MDEYVAANQNSRHFIKQVLWSWGRWGGERKQRDPPNRKFKLAQKDSKLGMLHHKQVRAQRSSEQGKAASKGERGQAWQQREHAAVTVTTERSEH